MPGSPADPAEIPGQARDDEGRAGHDEGRGGPGAQRGSVIPANAGISSPAVLYQAAALVLAYPDEALLARLDVIEAALDGTPDAPLFAPVLSHLRSDSLRELQSFHVQEFDLSRRHAMHLSYWTDGDTRRRGNVLAEIKQVYRDSGLVVDTGGELPDYLPMVLEFVVLDPERGRSLLERFRASLELIRLELSADDLPHAGVLTALCNRLPGESPRNRAEVQARFGQTQPVELVGLELAGHGMGDPGIRRDDGRVS
ncbi:MAG: nitrate reductase molybdenum cofactor assembly chaperone [Micropruina sp.]|nr:nitrate reductase molybdenum cofactor assembly chaperone [Micropruina sp.]